MVPIASLHKLRELFLDGDLIDDESLRHLTSLSHLHALTLYSAPISNIGLKYIAQLTSIHSLQVPPLVSRFFYSYLQVYLTPFRPLAVVVYL